MTYMFHHVFNIPARHFILLIFIWPIKRISFMHNLNHDKSRSIFYFLHLLIFLFIYTLEKSCNICCIHISGAKGNNIVLHTKFETKIE